MFMFHGLDLAQIGQASKKNEDLSFPQVFCIFHGGTADLEEILSQVSDAAKKSVEETADAIAGAKYVLAISFVGAREHKKIPALIEALTLIESRLRMLAEIVAEQAKAGHLDDTNVKLRSIEELKAVFDKLVEELKER